jgi:hypothetical protein
LKNTKISIFGGISNFSLGQILAVSGSFGQIWTKSVELAVADSMPKDH